MKSKSKQGLPVSIELYLWSYQASLDCHSRWPEKITNRKTSLTPFIFVYVIITRSIQVVHRIQGCMEEKLENYFKRDTECLDHNTWLISCMIISCFVSWWLLLYISICPTFRYDIITKCYKDDPNLRPSFKKLRNKLKEMENQHKVELQSLQRDSVIF